MEKMQAVAGQHTDNKPWDNTQQPHGKKHPSFFRQSELQAE